VEKLTVEETIAFSGPQGGLTAQPTRGKQLNGAVQRHFGTETNSWLWDSATPFRHNSDQTSPRTPYKRKALHRDSDCDGPGRQQEHQVAVITVGDEGVVDFHGDKLSATQTPRSFLEQETDHGDEETWLFGRNTKWAEHPQHPYTEARSNLT